MRRSRTISATDDSMIALLAPAIDVGRFCVDVETG
jgi:hypothetical protein